MPKYYNTLEFKALAKEWNLKLKAQGFDDIEQSPKIGLKSPLLHKSGHPRRRNAKTGAMLLAFFMKLDGYLADYGPTLPQRDRQMLELWSSGAYVITIAKSLKCNERTVRRCLSRYKKIVLAL